MHDNMAVFKEQGLYARVKDGNAYLSSVSKLGTSARLGHSEGCGCGDCSDEGSNKLVGAMGVN